MAPSNLSPNRDNYAIMRGIVLFRKTGDANFRHVGNVSDLEYAPKVSTLDHFSSMVGIKSKDLTVVLEKGGDLKMVMDEHTADNMELILLGPVDATDPLNIALSIFSETSVTGELKFYGTNEIGPRWDFDFLNVDFLPTGTLKMISDTFTYAWKKDGTPIGGATGKTYTTVVGDVGGEITCTVTGTNTIGNTAVTTPQFGPIT